MNQDANANIVFLPAYPELKPQQPLQSQESIVNSLEKQSNQSTFKIASIEV